MSAAPTQLPFTSQPVAPPPARRRRFRWLKRLLPLFTLLLLAVWFAPAVVAKTELRNHFARKALADLRGSVDVGGASLGWLSPVELRDVTIRDEAGRTLVSLPKVTSAKSLFALARNTAEPGEFTVEKPTVAVVCEKTTTNVEGAFAEYLKDTKPAAPTRTPVSLRVVGGTLTITDADNGKTSSIEDIGATVAVPASRAEPVTMKVTAATGGLTADLSLGESGFAKVVTAGLPLDTFAPLLKRADPGLTLAGVLATDLKVTWGKDAAGKPTFAASGVVGAKSLAVGGPTLNGDTLSLDFASLPLEVELVGRVVRVRRFDLACDVGSLLVAGIFDPDQPAESLFAQPGVVVGADVELAKLAAKLPKLLRVKEGIELREGRLKVDLASKPDGGGAVWEGTVRTSAIKAVRNDKPIVWDEPLNVKFVGRYASGKLPTLDVVCTSDFFALHALTTPDTVQLAATVYLNQLGARLNDFLDLGGVSLGGISLDGFLLGGEATVQFVGKREADGAFKAVGAVELKEFAFTDRGGKGLREPALKLQLSANGNAPANGPLQLAAASVALDAGGDELHLTLLEPLADARQLSSGVADVRLSGDINRWKERAAAFTKIPAYQMSGRIVATGKARLAPDRVAVERLTVGLTNVKFRGAGLLIDEPAMNAVGDFNLNRQTSLATVANMTLNSVPLSVAGGSLSFETQPDGEVFVSGSGPCVVDLNRLGATVKLYADARGPYSLHGRGVGPVRFRAAGDLVTFGGSLDVTDFAYGPKAEPVWAEPTLRLEADGDYRNSSDSVGLSVAKVSRPGLDLDAKGSVSKATTAQEVSVAGTVRYDWAKLTPLVRDLVGPSFTATGSGTRDFAISGTPTPPGSVAVATLVKGGPIELRPPGAPPKAPPAGPGVLAAVSGEAALGWGSIRAYGFDVGAGELRGKMTHGVVSVSPISATFGGGKVTLAPTLKLDTSPGEVLLAKGQIVDRAKLTPAATAGALGYALPAIANAGQAEGEISAGVEEARITLGDFTRTELKGVLLVHKATVSASPVVAEVAKLLGAKNTTMTLASDLAVPVQVTNGRVHHQNFAVNVAGTTIRTSGSVGFDNSLALVVEVPLPKDLPALKGNPLLAKALAGKTVKVPIVGTLERPVLDPKGFERAVAELAREGAKDVGKDLIEGELNKLFPGMGANPKPSGLPLPFGKKP